MKTTFTTSKSKAIKATANELRNTLSACLNDIKAVVIAVNMKEVQDTLRLAKKNKETKRVTELTRLINRAEAVKVSEECAVAVAAMMESGLSWNEITPRYIVEHLTGTDYVDAAGRLMRKNSKKEWVPREEWTIGVAVDLLRRANAAHCKSVDL